MQLSVSDCSSFSDVCASIAGSPKLAGVAGLGGCMPGDSTKERVRRIECKAVDDIVSSDKCSCRHGDEIGGASSMSWYEEASDTLSYKYELVLISDIS
jgi:hypothetical protein